MLSKILRNISLLFKPGVEISYSKLNAYLSCPYKYLLVYEKGMKVPPNPYISLGQSVHRALEGFHLKKAGDIDDLMDCYNASWVNEGFNSPQQAFEFFEKGRRMLESYYRDSLNLKTEVLFVEKEFRFKLGKHLVRGIMDRVDRHPDGKYEVIDYKTHSEMWKQDKADADLQLSVYALGCERALGFKPDLLTFYFVAAGERLSTTRSSLQLAAAARTAADIAGRISCRVFTPNPSFCPRCDFKKTCPRSTAKKEPVQK